MREFDMNNILALINSKKGEIVCRDCLNDEELSNIPEEEVITRDKLESGDIYFCSRCQKRL